MAKKKEEFSPLVALIHIFAVGVIGITVSTIYDLQKQVESLKERETDSYYRITSLEARLRVAGNILDSHLDRLLELEKKK